MRADLGLRRVEYQLDPPQRFLHGRAVACPDRDRADDTVVVDADVGAGFLLYRVDHLALGPDDLADLVHRDLDGHDLGRRVAHLGAGLADRRVHDLEDRQAGFPGLAQSVAEHRRPAGRRSWCRAGGR